jgi:hypothetical protein
MRAGFLVILLLITVPMAAAFSLASLPPAPGPATPAATPSGHIATAAEVEAAMMEWQQTEHAHSYDQGMGANTTCARCKSPMNWDPGQFAAQEMAVDCAACKREPGAPRPELSAGIPVPEAEWHNITCEICHQPAGDSYIVTPVFWNQATNSYEPVADSTALCAHCHEGQHGFEVVAEQEAAQVHKGMTCTDCHGAHGREVRCQECHDPESGAGAAQHGQHESVHCTACHDAGGLSIWQDPEPTSTYYGQYITRRFAHTLTSWPAHNLSAEVDCRRCHHPQGDRRPAIVENLSCTICHEHEYGAVSEWCIFFNRDPAPNGEGWQP